MAQTKQCFGTGFAGLSVGMRERREMHTADDRVHSRLACLVGFTQGVILLALTPLAVAQSVQIDLSEVPGRQSRPAEAAATLTNGPGTQAALAGTVIGFDKQLLAVNCTDCQISPEIGPGTAADKSLFCELQDSSNPAQLRVVVQSTANDNPIPDGKLFTCSFHVGCAPQPGDSVPLSNAPFARAPDRSDLPAAGQGGTINVLGCPGDCDLNGQVTAAERDTCVRTFLELDPFQSCPSADANNDGALTIGDVIQCIASSLDGCSALSCCGNGVIDPGEVCDDSAGFYCPSGTDCASDCKSCSFAP
jgi:hypothetical protein